MIANVIVMVFMLSTQISFCHSLNNILLKEIRWKNILSSSIRQISLWNDNLFQTDTVKNHHNNNYALPKLASNQSIVICGPSGVGKGTIITRLLENYPTKLSLSVSHTSRLPRPGEINGFHYHFVSEDFMLDKIAKNSQDLFFLENAEVHGHYYGTSFQAIQSIHEQGKICILDVDVKGVQQIKKSGLLSTKYLFIAPPSLETLFSRLTSRGTETKEQLEIRLKNAKEEVEYGLVPNNFEMIIVNDDLEAAIIQVEKYLQTSFPHIIHE